MKGILDILSVQELKDYNELPDDQREWYLAALGKFKMYKAWLLARVAGKSFGMPRAVKAGSKTLDLASVMPADDDDAGAVELRPWQQPEAGRPWERAS
jgi:hypothetical protein